MSLFNTIKIQTPESVELEFVLAGVGSRAVALIIDYVILGFSLLLIFWFSIYVLSQLSQIEVWAAVDTATVQLWVMAIAFLILFAVYVGYFVGFETAWYGQTPGKRYAKIRVIQDDAQPVRVFQATLRSLLRPVDDILFLGFFCILFNKREKRLGDWLAGTLVVQIDPDNTKNKITTSADAKAMSAVLIEVMDFNRVSPDDFATVRAYLQRRPMLTAIARKEVSLQLARQMKEKVKLETLPAEMTADTFLEAVYWGYQERNQKRAPNRPL
ncbi:MAG: RDD family protein [Cyanobacteria bacterium J06621_3]